MKENQKELSNQKDTKNYSERKILVGKIVLTIILGFNMFKMVCQIFNLNLPSINTFIDILEDSNFFLTLLLRWMKIATFSSIFYKNVI